VHDESCFRQLMQTSLPPTFLRQACLSVLQQSAVRRQILFFYYLYLLYEYCITTIDAMDTKQNRFQKRTERKLERVKYIPN